MVTKERHLHEQSTQCCYLHQPQCNEEDMQKLSGDSLCVCVCVCAHVQANEDEGDGLRW